MTQQANTFRIKYDPTLSESKVSPTFLTDWLQKLSEPLRDSSQRLTGVSSPRQQERQQEVEALRQPKLATFAENYVIGRGLGSRRHGIRQALHRERQ